MIIQMKSYMQTWLVRIFFGLMLFSLMFGFIASRLFKGWQPEGPWLLTINGSTVLKKEYDVQLQMEQARLAALYKQYGINIMSLMKNFNFEDLALQSLMREKLFGQVAHALHMQVSGNNALVQLKKQLPASLLDESGDIQAQVLLELFPMYRSLDQVKARMQVEIEQDMIQAILQSGYYIPEFVVQNQFEKTYKTADYQVLKLTLDNYLQQAKKEGIGQKALEAFYAQESASQASYWIPEKRSGIRWEFIPSHFAIEISSSMIESYYKKNKRQLFLKSPTTIEVRRILFALNKEFTSDQVAKIKSQAQTVLDELKKTPDNFAKFVKQYSQDKATSDKGGIIKVTQKREDHEFDRAVYKLRNNGDISDVIHTPDGFEILQRVSRAQETYKDLKSVEQEIKKTLEEERFKGIFERTLKRLFSSTITDEREAAIKKLIEEKHAVEFTMHEVENNQVNASIAKLFTLHEGSYGYIFHENKGEIIKLVSITKKKLKPLSAVKKEVEQAYYQQEAKKLMAQVLDDALKQIRSHDKKFEEVAQSLGVSLIKTGFINIENAVNNAQFKRLEIPFQELQVLSEVGSVKKLTKGDAAYIVMLVEEKPFDKDAFEKQKEMIEKRSYKSEEALVQAGFIASLHRNATIIRNKNINLTVKKRI